MSAAESGINHVSDTALLVAACRAFESDRPDAFFRDPFAARLAGERGLLMFRKLPHQQMMGFGIAIRTRLLDDLLLETVASGGVTNVLNLGSGLDTRPWRLQLPPNLRWIEVDFPAMLDYKDEQMDGEKPRCCRERLSADLNDAVQRSAIYAATGGQPTLLLSEGLLMYLPAATVNAIAAEPGWNTGLATWISDITITDFSNAIGGGGTRSVRHVQADDHLKGEQVLETLSRHGWKSAAHRSYIKDLGFANGRIKQMMAGQPEPPKQPNFAPDDPTGIHLFKKAS